MSQSSTPMIVIGDKTTHGGTVVGGATTVSTHAKIIARAGDLVTCPTCGSTTIATGDNTMIIMGQPVARHGDKTACGATLISSQSVTTTGPGGNGGTERSVPTSVAAVAVAAAAGVAVAEGSSAKPREPSSHAVGFRLIDEETGMPLARQPIRLLVDGVATDATTDEEGCIQAVYTGNAPQNVECRIMAIDDLFRED